MGRHRDAARDMVRRAWCAAAIRARGFAREEDGAITEYLLIIGVIAVPLTIFLAIFGQEVVTWVQQNAPNIFDEADNWVG